MDAPDPFRQHLQPFRRRLFVYLRALLATESEASEAFQETIHRLDQQSRQAPKSKMERWCEHVAMQVASERRTKTAPLPFTDDLFRQLADTLGAFLDRLNLKEGRLGTILERFPPPDRELLRRKHELQLTPEQIAITEERSVSQIRRDLTLLNASIVSGFEDDAPLGSTVPGGAMDLGRLADQLLDGTIGDDGRIVLETLLLSDTDAQAHYLRHVALACEWSWLYRGEPELTAAAPSVGSTIREKLITTAFVLTCALVLALVTFVVGRRLNVW